MLAPSLSDLTADVTYTGTSSSMDEDSSDASSCTSDDSSVVASGSQFVKPTRMAIPTLATISTSSLTEKMRFLPNCHACLADAIFWEEDSLLEDGDSLKHATITTIHTAAPLPLKLTKSPSVYANPPAYYQYYQRSKKTSCRDNDKVHCDPEEPKARQTWGLPMI